MNKYTKVLILTLLFPLLAYAGGEIIRKGDLIVLKADCLAFTTGSLERSVQEGTVKFGELQSTFLRNPTTAEQAVCDGVAINPPQWRVAKNGTSITRPVYQLVDPATNERKAVNVRAKIGILCENSVTTYSYASSAGREWRYLPGQTTNIVLCEYK